jgi:kynureninase
MSTLTRNECERLDAADPIAHFRDEFFLPDDVIYLDGNSLGAVPRRTPQRVAQAVKEEWGGGLIRSWNSAGWIEMPMRIGDKIARLIGANAGEVVVADSTSVNVFKVLSAALSIQAQQTNQLATHLEGASQVIRTSHASNVILSEQDNFPTDLYITQGLIQQLGNQHCLQLTNHHSLITQITDETAVVLLTHVNYRTGRMHDMRAITAKAHQHGALVIWDLAHSAGAVPLNLNEANADFAVGCGYKYLNGGPGSPAFLFVAHRHLANFAQPLSGWMGHAQPFAFDWQYQPAQDITRGLVGSPPILSMTALECGVDLWLEADMQAVRKKSLALSDMFIALVEERCTGFGLELVTPRDHDARGSQVNYRHPHGYAIMQALIAAGVIGDFRAPDILRFGFTPLYNGFVDVWDAVDRLHNILQTEAWRNPAFQQRSKVT